MCLNCNREVSFQAACFGYCDRCWVCPSVCLLCVCCTLHPLDRETVLAVTIVVLHCPVTGSRRFWCCNPQSLTHNWSPY